MRVKSTRLVFLLAVVLALTVSAVGQEGHPLTGTWYGDFGSTPSKRNDLTVIMSWDGKVTTGTVNPGPAAVALKTVRMDITPGVPAAQGQRAVPGGDAGRKR